MGSLLGGLGAVALVLSFLGQAGAFRPALRVVGAALLLVAGGMVLA